MPLSNISQNLQSEEARETLKLLLSSDCQYSRTGFVRKVCEIFDFRDYQGKLRTASCLPVLKGIEKNDPDFKLPASRELNIKRGPRFLCTAVAGTRLGS